MPRDTMIVGPRPGHIDMEGDMASCHVGVSVETRLDPLSGQVISMLHLDVARGGEIDSPFSVGIPLNPTDAATVVASLTGANANDVARGLGGDRLN